MKKGKETQLVLATHNAGKLAEFQDLLAPFGWSIVGAKALGLPEPEETGTSFYENAKIKAQAAQSATGLPALSDDSGLEVQALGGAPGVYTADWATQSDGSRNFSWAMEKVERALQEVGAKTPVQRRARFVSVICLALPSGGVHFFEGTIEGHLVWPPRGNCGFGFDAMFQPEGYQTTFGEMSAQEKHGWHMGQESALSHRARAFKNFVQALSASALF